MFNPKTREDDEFEFHGRPIRFGLLVTFTSIPKGDPREKFNILRVRGWETTPSGRRAIITDRIFPGFPGITENRMMWETRDIGELRPL